MANPVSLRKLLTTKGNLNNSYSNSYNLDSLESSNSNNIAISYKLYKGNRSSKEEHKYNKQLYVEQKADYIESKIGNPQGRLFYLKCAWHLREQIIDDILERALTKKSPSRYFCSAAKLELLRTK